MNGLLRNIEKILRNRRTRRKLQRTISLFAAIVVFITTYSLVIPAITMEKNAGCGIEEHQHDDSCYEDQLICGLEESEEHQHTADCYERVLVCGKEAHTHSEACYPAETYVEVDAGTDNSENTDDADATAYTDGTAVDGVDTSVGTTDGGEITVPVSDPSDGYGQVSDGQLTDGFVTEDPAALATDSTAAAYPAVIFDDAINVRSAGLTTDTEVGTDSGLQTVLDETSLFVHVEADEETFPEGTTMVLSEVTDDTIDTVATAVEGALSAQDAAVNAQQAEDASQAQTRTRGFHALDISFYDLEGNKIEPLRPVRVSITSDAIRTAVQDETTVPVVVHVEDQTAQTAVSNEASGDPAAEKASNENAAAGSDTALSSIVVEAAETTEAAATGRQDVAADAGQTPDTLTFEAGAFSVYAIVYTVDFHWEVDGNTYDFSIPGGGFVSFYDLVKELGIAADNTDTEKDEIQELVEGVETITFSNPELVSVSKTKKNTTVGAIKDGLGLECEYSADLTEKQIAEINAQEVLAGDWALISLKPFDTEESMTVTMINGETWTVKVTDAQISTHVITADGEDFLITVTYSEDAGIPDKATLEAEEITVGSEEYREYYEQTVEAVDSETGLTYVRFFDVTIWDDKGNIVEPKAAVETKIEYSSYIPLNPDSNSKVVHFADSGIEVIDVDLNNNESATEFTFNQNSFSVIGTVVSGLAEGDYMIYGYQVTINGNRVYRDEAYKTNPNYINSNTSSFACSYIAMTGSSSNWYGTTIGTSVLNNVDVGYGRATYNGEAYTNNLVLWKVKKRGDGYVISSDNFSNQNYLGISKRALSFVGESLATTWTYSNGQLKSGNYYLVYTGSGFSVSTTAPTGTNIYFAWNNTTGHSSDTLTVHYIYQNGNSFTEESTKTISIRDSNIEHGSQEDLRKGIPSGKQYVKTVLSEDSSFTGNGTEIHYFLQTNYGTTWNNANDKIWLFRETTSSAFGYGNEGGRQDTSTDRPYETDIVTGGVSAYRSFGDEKDIYVLYRDYPGASSESPEVQDIDAPEIAKQKYDNSDGTYDISLSVTGAADSNASTGRANIVVIMDASWSMLEKDANTAKTLSRLKACKNAAKYLANELYKYNENDPEAIEMTFMYFAQRVLNERELNTTYKTYDGFADAVDTIRTSYGTNWEAAMDAAKNIQWSDGDPVYIIFVSDGNPNSRSTAEADKYDISTWDSGNYPNSDGADSNVLTAAERVSEINNLKGLFSIGAFDSAVTGTTNNNLTKLNPNLPYVTYENFTPDSEEKMNAAADKIISSIQSSIGYQNVKVTDGITALTSTALVNGNADNFRYEVAKYNFDSEGNRTTKIEGTEATVTKNDNGTLTIKFPDNTSATINQASYDETNKQVTWDMGSDYQLKDGYSYDVKFTVWPSQESYDLIADLNNGVSRWVVTNEETGAAKIVYGNDVPDHVLPEHGKREYGTEYTKQIAKSGNSYSLKTNVDNGNIVTYTKVKTVTENGVTTTTRENGQSEFKNPDPMPLDNQLLPLVKKWDDTTDATQRPDSVSLDLHRTTPKTSSAAATDIVYLDKMVLSNAHVNTDGDWTYYNDEAVTDKDKISIAPGLMVSEDIGRFSDSYPRFIYDGKTYALLDTGHDYYFVENPLDYHFELTNYTYHPMLINGELWNVTFSYDDAGNITEVKLINKMSEISATNTLKGRLYVTKEVEIPEGAIGYDLKTTTFPITITLKDKDGNALVGEGPATDENPHLNGVMYRIQYGKNHPSSDEGWHEWSDEFQNCGRSSQKLFTNGVITENIYAGDAIYVGNLPAGATYEVTEGTLSGGWKLVSITYDDQTKKIAGNDEDQVTVKNTLPSFTVGILKTRQDGTTALKDAKFDLYGSDYYTEDSSGKTVVNSEAVALKNNLTSGTDGTFNLGFLAGGTYYLVETSAPDGYNKLVNPVIITVDGTSTRKKDNYPLYVTYEQDGQTISSSNEGVAITTETDDKGHVTYIYQLTVVNDEGVELPNTGGPGTNIIYLLGIMLSVFAGAGLVMKTCGKAA